MKRCHDGKCAFKQNGDIIEELAREYQTKLEKNGISVPKKERNCCMLSSNQPNKIIQEDLFTKKNCEFSLEKNFRKEKVLKNMIQRKTVKEKTA